MERLRQSLNLSIFVNCQRPADPSKGRIEKRRPGWAPLSGSPYGVGVMGSRADGWTWLTCRRGAGPGSPTVPERICRPGRPCSSLLTLHSALFTLHWVSHHRLLSTNRGLTAGVPLPPPPPGRENSSNLKFPLVAWN